MYLKKIEIKGFKSFADKTALEFGEGITAIVGPNGSGKSNISDSIRWVLGEQSAKTLRGGKMEDVIFAGTQNRKQLGCAQVDLTIDNNDSMLPFDYSEITVSRRLYRSGESEYLINNTPCRLKDITELFLDTGIGKDGYSLIGQGKIDEILSTRPEDRRNIFEEAAGIVKYKLRKEESQKKLEATRINLERVEDIIAELEEQVTPLEEQSKVAKKYLELYEELKAKEINLLIYKYEEEEKKLKKVESDIKELTLNKETYQIKKNELEALNDELKKEQLAIDNNIEKLNEKQLDEEKKYENKIGNLNLYKEKIENYNREYERLLAEVQEQQNKAKSYEFQGKQLMELKASIDTEIKSHSKLINEFTEEYDRIKLYYSNSFDEVEDKKSELIQILKDISELNNKVNLINANINNLNERRKQILRDNQLKNEKKTELEDELRELDNKVNELYEDINDLNINKEDLNINKLAQEKENENLAKSRTLLFDKLKSEEARFRTLNSMEKDMEGFNRAVKAIIQKFKDGKKVFGTVSNIIDVPNGYEIAIEIALGAAIQNIVVDCEDNAQDLIRHLKLYNLGRATFLPLTTVKPRELKIKFSEIDKGYLGAASDIIKYDEKYKNVILNLLGRIIICDNLSNARVIAKKLDYNYKIVTLDGDIINAGGSFTGGSTNLKNSGIISRKNEIMDLGNSIGLRKTELARIEDKISSNLSIIKEINKNLEDLNKMLQDKSIMVQTYKNKMSSILKLVDDINEEISDNLIEIEQLDHQGEMNEEYLKDNTNKIKSLNDRQNKEEIMLEEIQKNCDSIQVKISEISNKITDEKIVFAEKSKVLESTNSKISDINNLIQETRNKIDQYNNEIRINAKKTNDIEESIKASEVELKELEFEIKSIRNELSDLTNYKKGVESRIEHTLKELKINDNTLNGLIQSIHKLELLKSKLEADGEMRINKIWDDYEISIPQAHKYKKEIANVSEEENNIKKLKDYIKALGNVNVNSIEEYKRVIEKYTFLKSQREDLINAQTSLEGIIGSITKKMRNQFEKNFNVIKDNFNLTFKELFGGGNGDLRINGEDVLTAGIDIIVQPPGKKFQSLSLLSGGEKGLAAIALIFAILKMKPTPFCVLDEIEAALDDANVNRFASFLKIYSSKTQFIMITHRKGSMAVANALYGVTMEEKGISKLLSLKLKGVS